MTDKQKRMIGAVLFAVFLAMFLYGSTTAEVNIVLKKAVNICLECIGLGG